MVEIMRSDCCAKRTSGISLPCEPCVQDGFGFSHGLECCTGGLRVSCCSLRNRKKLVVLSNQKAEKIFENTGIGIVWHDPNTDPASQGWNVFDPSGCRKLFGDTDLRPNGLLDMVPNRF